MADRESRFTFRVETEGAEQARRALLDIEKAGGSAGAEAAKTFSALSQSVEKMGPAVDRLVDRMERLGRVATKTARAQKSALRSGVADGTSVAGRVPMPPASVPAAATAPAQSTSAPSAPKASPAGKQTAAAPIPSEAPMRRGAGRDFGLGLFQSLIPGNLGFLQRGPGAIPQGLGLMAGRSLGGLASIPFSGSGGMAHALDPLGPLALPFQRFMSRAESAQSFQRQQLDMAPLLGSAGVATEMSPEQAERARRYAMGQGRTASQADTYLERLQRQQRERQITAAGAAPARLMGASAAEGQAFASQLATAGGGRVDRMTPGFVQAAMAAKTTYGLDPSTLGAFALGGRTGAVKTSGGKDAESLLLSAIGQVRSLGLEGADAQQYLQQIAEGIRSFQQSGMPLQMDSVRDITAGMKGLGLNPLAAERAAQNAVASSQSFLRQGPQSGADLMMMRAGGFTGGLHSYLATKRKLGTDAGAFTQSAIQTLPQLAQGDDREVAIEAVSSFLSDKGISGDPRVAERLVDSIRSGQSPEAAFAAAQKTTAPIQAPTAAGLGAEASSMISPTMMQSAVMANQNLTMGADAVKIANELESAANDTASVFSRFAGGLLSLAKLAHTVGNAVTGGGAPGSAAPAVRPAN